jgi:hypothetical protein
MNVRVGIQNAPYFLSRHPLPFKIFDVPKNPAVRAFEGSLRTPVFCVKGFFAVPAYHHCLFLPHL